MIRITTLLFCLLISFEAFAQNNFSFQAEFDWRSESFVKDIVTEEDGQRVTFKNASFNSKNPYAPIFSKRFPVNSYGDLTIEILDVSFLDESPVKINNLENVSENILSSVQSNIQFYSRVDENRRNYYGKIFFVPIIKTAANELLFVESISLKVYHKPKKQSINKTPPVTESVLNQGDIYKLEISKEGVHKLTGAFLQNTLNINLSEINPDNIQIFSNPGGKVANSIQQDRIDDLQELSVYIEGDNDGKIDNNDAIYFYAEGAESWTPNGVNNYYNYNDNPFTTKNYAFLKIGSEKGKRIIKSGQNSSDITTVDKFIEQLRYENNKYNLQEENFGTLGTGQEWYGEYFDLNKTQDFSSKFNFKNVVENSEASVKLRFIGRASNSSKVELQVDDKTFSDNINGTSLSSYVADYAKIGTINEVTTLSSNNPSIIIDYSQNSSAEGWLDYLEIQYQRKLNSIGNQLTFSNILNGKDNPFNFVISNVSNNYKVWNITNSGSSFEQNLANSNSNISFTCPHDEFNKFVVFDPGSTLLTPEFLGKVDNQNLHSIQKTDMVIVFHPKFEDEAKRLMEHRLNNSDLTIRLINVNHIFNEFAGGKEDPTAIRDFFKMIYDRDPDFRYTLLFGNGSFDYKGINHDKELYNLVPVYETRQSLNAIYDFPCDDYFALLSDQDGGDLRGEVDIAIGRIPVNNASQARTVVDKIIKYETNPEMRGAWNLRSIFAADDEDTNTHVNQADEIAEKFLKINEDINLTKIYWDAYNQVSTPGGERYPEVTADINSSIFKGALTFCYLGHGGPSGWAQERVLQIKDIDNWSNNESLPLFITATCSLSSYDDPTVFSAGEKILVNENGGIGLFTTCRAVYASDNKRLTKSTFDFIVDTDNNGELYRLGEIMRLAKNKEPQDTVDINARKFLLLGDPSMKLLYPTYDVVTESINDIPVVDTIHTDTISALGQMKIRGYISDKGEKLTSFNGEINVTVYDKRTQRRTLAQDSGSREKTFLQRKNLIFKGNAQVVNGEFELEFIVPKDILYNYGEGKISYYASNGTIDAKGNYQNFIIGGTSENAVQDDTPPVVQVFMNNEDFAFGGMTSPNPVLFAKINDDQGINLSGSSIGHDLTAELNEDSKNTYLLNDFYESELNDYSSGIVEYPLSNLENGKYTIKVQAWDIANNVGEGFTEFVVSDNLQDGLSRVLNYPNPFTDNTCFMFEHNFAPDVLDVQINIFTTTGRLIKTINHNTMSDGFRVQDIKWDGTDDFGSYIGRGVYLYKIKVKALSQNLIKESDFEKLVILK